MDCWGLAFLIVVAFLVILAVGYLRDEGPTEGFDPRSAPGLAGVSQREIDRAIIRAMVRYCGGNDPFYVRGVRYGKKKNKGYVYVSAYAPHPDCGGLLDKKTSSDEMTRTTSLGDGLIKEVYALLRKGGSVYTLIQDRRAANQFIKYAQRLRNRYRREATRLVNQKVKEVKQMIKRGRIPNNVEFSVDQVLDKVRM